MHTGLAGQLLLPPSTPIPQHPTPISQPQSHTPQPRSFCWTRSETRRSTSSSQCSCPPSSPTKRSLSLSLSSHPSLPLFRSLSLPLSLSLSLSLSRTLCRYRPCVTVHGNTHLFLNTRHWPLFACHLITCIAVLVSADTSLPEQTVDLFQSICADSSDTNVTVAACALGPALPHLTVVLGGCSFL